MSLARYLSKLGSLVGSNGKVPTAGIDDLAVTAAKLHTTAVTDKLGYTPVNKAGDSSMQGFYTRNVTDAYCTGLGVPQSEYVLNRTTNLDRRGWVLCATVSLDNPGSGGTQYIHLLTNYASQGAMMLFHLEGYAYNYGNVDVKHGLYMYSGSQILNKYTANNGNGVTFYNSYKNGTGYLVLVINLGQSGYTSARARLWVQGHSDEFADLKITDVARTSATTYF